MSHLIASGVSELTKHASPVTRTPSSLSLLVSLALLLSPAAAQAAGAPSLGSAAAFAALAASTVANTGPSNLIGDLGVSPGSAIVGFPPGSASGTQYTGAGGVAGTAQADALTAYNNAAGLVCDTNMTGVDLGGKILTPGVYCFNTSAQLTGILILDSLNDPNAVFVFQTGSTLTTGANSAVQLVNGTPACGNIVWKVGSSATLGIATQFKGNILAMASVTLTTGANNAGGLYGLTGGVTLDTSAVQACGLPPVVCTTDDECIDDGNLCTDEVCAPGTPGADSFGCTHPNNTAPCDDLQFCNGEDICLNGDCESSGDPCLGGGECGDTCNELTNDCFVLAGTECRASVDVCDEAEDCTGLSASCPLDGFLDSTNQCRGSAGVCDEAENCTGQSASCPLDGFLDSTNQCRGSAGVCDEAETCTGQSALCPGDDFLSSSTQCRGSAGVCDEAETCTGQSALCPGDDFLSSSTQCRGSAGVCDEAETCTGQSALCPGDDFLSSSTQCRASAGVCDEAENCTGQSASCPLDGFQGSATQCRGSAGVCDVAETCSGSSPSCPSDGFLSSATICHGSAGVCDVTETCSGSSAFCPLDVFLSSATQCRASAGVCDAAETCSGSSALCPNDGFLSSATQCRASAGECDTAETCTGSTPSCPANSFLSSATLCRASAGECDVAENCTGSTASCPSNSFLSSATLCRASAGECDVAENCTGSAASCPSNSFLSSATQCRASAGECDMVENCTGATASCPSDSFLSSANLCRASVGECDVAENCIGSAALCPSDGFQAGGVACTDDAEVCTDDICNGAGACVHPNNTAECNDGTFCTVNDTCSNGTCLGATRNCADAVACTVDACNESTNACTHGASNALCSDERFCNGVETCNVQTGCVAGSPVMCGDGVQCTVDSCNESIDACQSLPSDERCSDGDHCTIDTCDAQDGCDHLYSCRDICRPAGFYGKRSGSEDGDANTVQSILDAVGGLEVCGQTITETSNSDSPYLEGLGLDSALEGLCVRARNVEQRSLYQELVATALNCTMSGSDSCDAVVSPFIDVSFSECDALCASGTLPNSMSGSSSLAEQCIDGLQCYNNGGRMVRGKCALGTCNFTGKSCGAEYGLCAPVTVKLVTFVQTCERFDGNCRNGDFCQPTIDVCPARTPVSSKSACKEAKDNDCTIDSCGD